MLADLQKGEYGYIARMERHLKHPVEQVWSTLTENDKLAQWFPELRVKDLREGGTMIFDMQNGTFEEMVISDCKELAVLEYEWGEDRVRFELAPDSAAECRLVFLERIKNITDHTPKDLAGWHVCLDVIEAQLDGRTLESRKQEWEKWYESYKKLTREILESGSHGPS